MLLPLNLNTGDSGTLHPQVIPISSNSLTDGQTLGFVHLAASNDVVCTVKKWLDLVRFGLSARQERTPAINSCPF